MPARAAAVAPPARHWNISPLFSLGCGVALMLGSGLVYWLEPGPAQTTTVTVPSEASAARTLQRAREREAQARAEFERQAAQEAEERARRAALLADGQSEAEARKQREEMARRQAAMAAAHRAAAETEDAWNRFYKPSERCRDPAAATSVECVNEYVKAKREFQVRQAARSN